MKSHQLKTNNTNNSSSNKVIMTKNKNSDWMVIDNNMNPATITFISTRWQLSQLANTIKLSSGSRFGCFSLESASFGLLALPDFVLLHCSTLKEAIGCWPLSLQPTPLRAAEPSAKINPAVHHDSASSAPPSAKMRFALSDEGFLHKSPDDTHVQLILMCVVRHRDVHVHALYWVGAAASLT